MGNARIYIQLIAAAFCTAASLSGGDILAQGKVKTGPVNGKSAQPVKAAPATATVMMSQADMVSAVNGGQSFSASPIGSAPVVDYKDSEVLQKIAAEELEDKIFGTKSSYEYGITYWSGPVKEKYDYYIAPYVADFITLNDEIYEGQKYKIQIAAAIAKQLALLAENTGTFVSPGSRGRLIAETINQFKNNPFDDESTQTEYYGDHLGELFKRVASGMSWKKDDFMNSAIMIQSYGARANCAVAVIVAQSKINTEKLQSDLTINLDNAKWGFLYKPLTDYVNQKSEFGAYAMKMKVLQEKTNGGVLDLLYDDRCNCPAREAFNIGAAVRANSGSVFNNIK